MRLLPVSASDRHRRSLTGTFLSGGFQPPEHTVDLPDPHEVTKGTLYRDESGQIWKLDVVFRPEDRPIPKWIRVTAVSARQQTRDRSLGYGLFTSAWLGAVLMYQIARVLEFGAPYGLLAVVVVFVGFVWASWLMFSRVHRHVVLPEEVVSVERFPDDRSTLKTHPDAQAGIGPHRDHDPAGSDRADR